jgi:uncharacterized protein (TIGR02757 family)
MRRSRKSYPAKGGANNLPTDIVSFGAPASDRALRAHLDRFLAGVDPAALAAGDPVSLVRPYADPADREVAGFLVAMLAYGRVASIKTTAKRALAALGPRPARSVDRGRFSALDGFVYRFQKGDDLVRFLEAVRRVRKNHGSLAEAFGRGVSAADADYGDAMASFVDLLLCATDGELAYGLKYLLPHPGRGGAAKRLCLYLRWMIRPDDGADLGAWSGERLDAARLVIPLDTHIGRIARYLGLTDRKSDDLVTARAITAALRRLRPDDPLAYDLALCHLGISGRCPRRRDVEKCAGCPIRPVCRLGPEPEGW